MQEQIHRGNDPGLQRKNHAHSLIAALSVEDIKTVSYTHRSGDDDILSIIAASRSPEVARALYYVAFSDSWVKPKTTAEVLRHALSLCESDDDSAPAPSEDPA